MPTRARSPRADRRADALSKERIVSAAIDVLDAEGQQALTFRALTARLATGPGAIYWHVRDKDDLLTAAADLVLTRALAIEPARSEQSEPREAVRAAALAVFDALDAHPWMGAVLSREPWQPAVMRILERVGQPLDALGVPEDEQFDAATALLNYVLGLAGQYAAGARLIAPGTGRAGFLAGVAEQWMHLDAEHYPFLRRAAAQLPTHDDRAQFLAGIEFILNGLAARFA